MKVAAIVHHLEALAPLGRAEDWDNVGLLVGDRDAQVDAVLLCVDLTAAVLAEAIAEGCALIVAYHPPIFKGLTRLLAGSVVYEAVRAGVALYSPHTALDAAAGGTNDALADLVGLQDRLPLRPCADDATVGMGRVGRIDPVDRGVLLDRIREGLGVDHLLVAGPATGPASRVAVCAGACGALLEEALAAEVDLYLTGELRHHDALRAAERGTTVVCTLHSRSERIGLDALRAALQPRLPSVRLCRSQTDRDPFEVR